MLSYISLHTGCYQRFEQYIAYAIRRKYFCYDGSNSLKFCIFPNSYSPFGKEKVTSDSCCLCIKICTWLKNKFFSGKYMSGLFEKLIVIFGILKFMVTLSLFIKCIVGLFYCNRSSACSCVKDFCNCYKEYPYVFIIVMVLFFIVAIFCYHCCGVYKMNIKYRELCYE